MSISLRTAQLKYRQTTKGREANSRCAKKHYHKNKDFITQRNKQRVMCYYCDKTYNRQYFRRVHCGNCPFWTD